MLEQQYLKDWYKEKRDVEKKNIHTDIYTYTLISYIHTNLNIDTLLFRQQILIIPFMCFLAIYISPTRSFVRHILDNKELIHYLSFIKPSQFIGTVLSDKDTITKKIVFVFKSTQHPVGKVLLQWCDEIEEIFTENS